MREVKHDLEQAKKRILMLSGMRIKIKVNRGRNRMATYLGCISATYPAVFTFEGDGVRLSFSYSDVLTGTVRFFRADNA